jgi:glycosyltransferase involved in cell wall biosynthesis
MRVFLWSNHTYPAGGRRVTSLDNRVGGSGGSRVIHDNLAKGLAELGHEVFYLLEGADVPLPAGVELVSEFVPGVDILHHYNSQWICSPEFVEYRKHHATPWVTTCHSDPSFWQWNAPVPDNWIFVSRTLARAHAKNRYVLNGIDPSEYEYAEKKDDYFLFISNFRHNLDKGLDTALALSRKMDFKLVVAGPCADNALAESVDETCAEASAAYLGNVSGERKARLFAGAKALLFPTKINEAFGLVMAEALISGTPVICSDKGACPELISQDVGFVCRDFKDYAAAVRKVENISPQVCRDKAMKEYHYLRMAADYVKEYEKEIESFSA